MDALKGKKTYITAGLVAAVTGLQTAGIVSPDQATSIYGMLAAFGLYALRQGVARP